MSAPTIAPIERPAILGPYLVILVCLVSLGALCGRAPLAVFGSLLGLLGLLFLAVLLALFSPKTRREHGFRNIASAVARGFTLLVPFTALAAVSYLWLHWDTAQAFASAGLMAAGAATGAEMVRMGGGRIVCGLLPLLWSMLLSLAWMLLGSLLAVLIT